MIRCLIECCQMSKARAVLETDTGSVQREGGLGDVSIHHHYLLQFQLWNSRSLSVRSPSTFYSSKTITICIRHEPLSPSRVNTNTFAERFIYFSPSFFFFSFFFFSSFFIFYYAGSSVSDNLPQTLRHSDSASSFKAAIKTHLFSKYF